MMNIFYTNPCPIQAADEHCYVHVVKMILESAQLLSAAHHILNPENVIDGSIYKLTHKNHPSSVWTRECDANYMWVHSMVSRLCEIYKDKTGKDHKAYSKIAGALSKPPVSIVKAKDGITTPIAVAINDEAYRQLKVDASTPKHEVYQHYMNYKFKEWTTRTDKRKMPVVFPCGEPNWLNY